MSNRADLERQNPDSRSLEFIAIAQSRNRHGQNEDGGIECEKEMRGSKN